MYWNPMSSWPDWFTTALAISGWTTVAWLLVYALREGFRSSPNDVHFTLETPEKHHLKQPGRHSSSGPGSHDG